MLGPSAAEERVGAFLDQFATTVLVERRERWALERKWYASFNGSAVGKGVCGSFIGSTTELLTETLARAAYDGIPTPSAYEYFVIPEIPATIAFACRGRLPKIDDWNRLAGPTGLPFAVTIVDSAFLWTLVLAGESPGLEPGFARLRIADGNAGVVEDED